MGVDVSCQYILTDTKVSGACLHRQVVAFPGISEGKRHPVKMSLTTEHTMAGGKTQYPRLLSDVKSLCKCPESTQLHGYIRD